MTLKEKEEKEKELEELREESWKLMNKIDILQYEIYKHYPNDFPEQI